MRLVRAVSAAVWLAAAVLVVLAARSIVYALATPVPLRGRLEQVAGGPRLVVLALVALAVCGALAATVVWLAAVGVRERAALAGVEPPRIRALRIAAHALVLGLVACAGFAALESFLHLRAGLGWHALGCLTGPVHVSAMPILLGLSALAAAAADGTQYFIGWIRRTIRLLLERTASPASPPPLLVPVSLLPAPPALLATVAQPRAPPFPA